ncbi:hypothetical protein FACS1894154_09430 [Betaproteobacteria bacterium]|nr:hypothetical protein FACS1894154_09430 [Betaproteobacteria bacterium]
MSLIEAKTAALRTAVLCALYTLSAGVGAADAAAPADDAAFIAGYGNATVTAAELRQGFAVLPPQAQEAIQRSSFSANNLAADLVTRKLVAERARAEGLDQNPEIVTRIAQTIDGLLQAEYIERHLKTTANPDLAERLARDDYRANPEKYKRGEQVHVRHILVKTCACSDENAKEQARLKAETLLGRIKLGESFEEIASTESDDPGSARRGGDLGFVTRGKMVKPFEDAAFALKKTGELSPVIETEYGYHILRLDARQEASVVPFGEVRAQLVAAQQDALQKDAYAKLMDPIRPMGAVSVDPAALRATVGGNWKDTPPHPLTKPIAQAAATEEAAPAAEEAEAEPAAAQ